MNIVVSRYQEALINDWSQVLSNSKNGLFLFDRNYIEYHGDRFEDISLIAYIDEMPIAIFPLALGQNTGEAVSHPGLTFGGVVLKYDVRGIVAIAVIEAFLNYLRELNIDVLMVKLLPQVFASYPSAEMDYVLWRRGFNLVRRDLSSILPLQASNQFNSDKRKNVNKARKAGLIISSASAGEFHDLLESVLLERHGISPVHTCEELKLLMDRFQSEIQIYTSRQGSEILAGAMIYKYGHVWHTQYLACSPKGRECGALDFVVSAVKDYALASGVKYISFGISTTDAGMNLNEGLLWQKESYGARSMTHDIMKGVLK